MSLNESIVEDAALEWFLLRSLLRQGYEGQEGYGGQVGEQSRVAPAIIPAFCLRLSPLRSGHYSLQAIIAVGFKIENERTVQFRKWAHLIVKDYTNQRWTMDAERLKHGDTLLSNLLSVANAKKIVHHPERQAV